MSSSINPLGKDNSTQSAGLREKSRPGLIRKLSGGIPFEPHGTVKYQCVGEIAMILASSDSSPAAKADETRALNGNPAPAFQSAHDFLQSLPPGPRAFDTWEEYEEFLRKEKDSWE